MHRLRLARLIRNPDDMFNPRKLPFWDKFLHRRPSLKALFNPTTSGDDTDSDFNVVITPAPDYDERSLKSGKDYWPMRRKSKKSRKNRKYQYDSDVEILCEQSDDRRHKRHNHNDRKYSSDSDSSFSTLSVNTEEAYRHRAGHKQYKIPRTDHRYCSPGPRRRDDQMGSERTRHHDHCSSSERKRKRGHDSSLEWRRERGHGYESSERRRERDHELPVMWRQDRATIPMRKHESTSARKKENVNVRCNSDKDKYRERRERGWDPSASDSSPETSLAHTPTLRKHAKCKKDRKRSASETDADGNWTLREKSGKTSDGLLLKITMNDLKSVITENMLSAVIRKGRDDDRGRQHVRCATPEMLSTDTETHNSGFSAGSNNSGDALLPMPTSRRMSSAFQPVPQRHSGLLKRFIPYSSPASSDSTGQSSVSTVQSFLSGTSGATDPGTVTRSTGHGCRPEDQLVTQTNSLKGFGVQFRDPRDVVYEENFPHEVTYINQSGGINRSNRFQDGQPSTEFAPRIARDRSNNVPEGPCILQDSSGRRLSVTVNGSFSDETDIPPIAPTCASLHHTVNQCSGNHMSDSFEHLASRRPSRCMDANALHIHDNFMPNPTYLARRRQSLPVTLSEYPHSTDLAAIGIETLLATRDAKVAPKEKMKEKCLSTVPEESVDSTDDKQSQSAEETNTPKKSNKVLPTSSEILKNKKQTDKEKSRVRCIKILTILSSLLFVLAGVGVLVLGVLTMMDDEAQMYAAVTRTGPDDNSFQYYCYGLCFVGASVVFAWFCGCLGAMKVNTCLLKMFISSLSLLMLLQGSMVGLVYKSQNDTPSIPFMAAILDGVKDVLLSHMQESLHESYLQDSTVGKAWDLLQVQAECCGCQSQDDYKYSAWWNATADAKTTMPDSCCVVAVKDLDDLKPTNKFLCQAMTRGFWHTTGCHEVLMVWYKQNSLMVFAATMSLVFLEIISFISAVRLHKTLNQKPKKSTDNVV